MGIQGCSVIVPELRGRRGSPDDGAAWTLDDHAADIAETVPGRFHLVGLSMGGYVALAFARQFPERLLSLVLVDSRAAPDSPQAAAGRYALVDRLRKEGTSILPDILLPRLLAPGAPDALKIEVARQMLETPAETAARDALAMANRSDARSWLPVPGVPALVIHGSEDALVPLDEAREVAELAHGELVVLTGAGHLAPMESPAEFAAALSDWVRRTSG